MLLKSIFRKFPFTLSLSFMMITICLVYHKVDVYSFSTLLSVFNAKKSVNIVNKMPEISYVSHKNLAGIVAPRPLYEKSTNQVYLISYEMFTITLEEKNEILSDAAYRCIRWIFPNIATQSLRDLSSNRRVKELMISVKNTSVDLSIGVDESYILNVIEDRSELRANTIWGALHGLETFSQLVKPSKDGVEYYIYETYIEDKPMFPFRGFLIDTSRHFLNLKLIKKHLVAMASVKLNVLHWHMVDNPSFPYVSKKFPELHTRGAFHRRNQVYTQRDLIEITSYAKYRGINILPEFDIPGHVDSWLGRNDILIGCYGEDRVKMINPSIDESYEFLKELFSEIKSIFKSAYIHIGGDEIDESCWDNIPKVQEYAKRIGATKSGVLHQRFLQYLMGNLSHLFSDFVGWEEIYINSGIKSKNIVLQIWKGWDGLYSSLPAVSQNMRLVISSGFYLDTSTANWKWEEVFSHNLHVGIPTDKHHLIEGGLSCQWGETVSPVNFFHETWVRTVVMAERFWSDFPKDLDLENSLNRFNDHHCRLLRRNIESKPLRESFRCI